MRKSLIIGLTVLSVMLYAGTAFSIEGPSATVVFPFICEVVPTGQKFILPEHLDMVFTLANVTHIDTYMYWIIRNFKSQGVHDEGSPYLSPFDVSSDTCLGLTQKYGGDPHWNLLKQTIGGKQYYVGYIEYDLRFPEPGQAVIGWGQMQTLRTVTVSIGNKLAQVKQPLTDAGFNGVPDFRVDVNAATIATATGGGGVSWRIDSNQMLMPRYKIANNDTDTHNWWIIMTPSDALEGLAGPGSTCSRIMDCSICDENENCLSNAVPIPYQVNVVNVADILPGLFATFPKAGFAMCEVVLQGFSPTGQNPCGNAGNEQYVGWSYQYTRGIGDLRTALIFPIHRQIGQGGTGLPGH